MDWGPLIGPAVVAAVIAGVVSLITLLMNRATTLATHSQRLAFEQKQAEQRTTAEIALAERKANADIALAERKFAFDQALADWKRRCEVAEQALMVFYEARDVLNRVRTKPLIREEMSSDMAGSNKITPSLYVTCLNNLTETDALFSRLRTLQFEFCALFGSEHLKTFDFILKIRTRITAAASLLAFSGEEPDQKGLIRDTWQKQRADLEKELGWEPAARPDEVHRDIDRAVAAIESVRRPVFSEMPRS